ncbi:MAG: hypothetical protein J1F66_03540 [Clostridiales bacterium]|nr:hypothetical protein [Clostridiales bacterium]
MAKKIFATIIVAILLLGICIVATGCPKEKTHDVSIRIVRMERYDYRGELVLELVPDGTSLTTEASIEFPYDGKEYYLVVSQYNVPDDLKYGDIWFTPNPPYSFSTDLHTSSEDGKLHDKVKYFCEKGNYSYSVATDYPSSQTGWNYHHFIINIKVV